MAVGDVTDPNPVRRAHAELAVQQVGRNGQAVVAVGRHLEATLALGPNAMQLHQLLDPLFAYPDTSGHQLSPRARPAIGAVGFGVDDFDMHQQCVVAAVATVGRTGFAHDVLVVPRRTGLKHPALD